MINHLGKLSLSTGLATALLLMPLAAAAQEIDPFYAQRLDDGISAFERGDHPSAIEELRIAAFGLLGSPERLAGALTHLALAQSASGDREAFEATYRRLLHLERKFKAYSAARLSGEMRAALDRGAATLPATIGPARLPIAAATSHAASTDTRPRVCISWTGDGTCDPAPIGGRTPSSSSSPSADELAMVGRLDHLAMDDASTRKLCGGFEQAREIANRHPEWSEPQRIAGTLASRCGSYDDAVVFYDRAGNTIEQRPDQLFYLSVALFETDRMDQAATVLRRALPALEQNREVRRYVRRILDQESAG